MALVRVRSKKFATRKLLPLTGSSSRSSSKRRCRAGSSWLLSLSARGSIQGNFHLPINDRDVTHFWYSFSHILRLRDVLLGVTSFWTAPKAKQWNCLKWYAWLNFCAFRLITQTPNGQYINPPSGTVADDVVTCPERYDFFLVRHVLNYYINTLCTFFIFGLVIYGDCSYPD